MVTIADNVGLNEGERVGLVEGDKVGSCVVGREPVGDSETVGDNVGLSEGERVGSSVAHLELAGQEKASA